MQIEIWVQYTRWTTWAYETGGHELKPEHWRTDDGRHWVYTRLLTEEEIRNVVNRYIEAINQTGVSYHGAYIRLKVKFSAQLAGEEHATEQVEIIDGHRSQTNKDAPRPEDVVSKLSVAQLMFSLKTMGPRPSTSAETTLPQLDETPVPAGTVVEVLDEWGLPTGSTEVT